MHELSLTQNLIEIVSEYAGQNTVVKVKLEIGKLSAISAEAILFCFDACRTGTMLENAELDITIVEAKGRCNSCGCEIILGETTWVCTCGSNQIKCISGMELTVKELEIV